MPKLPSIRLLVKYTSDEEIIRAVRSTLRWTRTILKARITPAAVPATRAAGKLSVRAVKAILRWTRRNPKKAIAVAAIGIAVWAIYMTATAQWTGPDPNRGLPTPIPTVSDSRNEREYAILNPDALPATLTSGDSQSRRST